MTRGFLPIAPSIVLLFCVAPTCFSQDTTSHASLKEAAERWLIAMETKDVRSIVSAFAQDVIAMYPHPVPIYGREANRKIWVGVYQDSVAEHPISIDTVQISGSGEFGFTYGKWWHSNPVKNHYSGGRYVAIWKKIYDEWQIVMLSAHNHDDVRMGQHSK